jgi:hypothetical protein
MRTALLEHLRPLRRDVRISASALPALPAQAL